ncbi:MAG: hypothetical protein ACRYFU_26080 [Janthinobacterium lividum]
MVVPAKIGAAVEADGFAIVEGVLSGATVEHLLTYLEHICDTGSVRKRGGIFAVRNLLDVSPEVRELAYSKTVRMLVGPVLGEYFFPVRGILFDKIPDANWKVPWHQDVTIAVQERVEAEGFGPWSMKADVLHVQPPGRGAGAYGFGALPSRQLRRGERCTARHSRFTSARPHTRK